MLLCCALCLHPQGCILAHILLSKHNLCPPNCPPGRPWNTAYTPTPTPIVPLCNRSCHSLAVHLMRHGLAAGGAHSGAKLVGVLREQPVHQRRPPHAAGARQHNDARRLALRLAAADEAAAGNGGRLRRLRGGGGGGVCRWRREAMFVRVAEFAGWAAIGTKPTTPWFCRMAVIAVCAKHPSTHQCKAQLKAPSPPPLLPPIHSPAGAGRRIQALPVRPAACQTAHRCQRCTQSADPAGLPGSTPSASAALPPASRTRRRRGGGPG